MKMNHFFRILPLFISLSFILSCHEFTSSDSENEAASNAETDRAEGEEVNKESKLSNETTTDEGHETNGTESEDLIGLRDGEDGKRSVFSKSMVAIFYADGTYEIG